MKRKTGKLSLLFLAVPALVSLLLLMAAGTRGNEQGSVNNTYTGKKAVKYVFLFVGDGMGIPQVSSAEIYAGAQKGGTPDAPRSLTFTRFPAQGLTTTHDASSFITDSASAGTAIATGKKTLNGVICMDPATKTVPYTAISRQAKAAGKKIGIVSSVSLDHATPAVFYANAASRGMMYEISLQMADSGFDYFAGGHVADPEGKKSKMETKPGDFYSYAQAKGYTVTKTKEDFLKLKTGAGKVIALTELPADAASMLYEIDRPVGALSLADFTRKGIELLDNPKGFFIMVEGGKIDWACHANDAMSSIRDVNAFDDAVKVAYEFYLAHPDETVIIVTGDHETGGMAIGFAGTKYDTFFTKLGAQKVSYVKFDDMLGAKKKANPSLTFADVIPMITENFGLTFKGDGSAMDVTPYEKKQMEAAFAETMKDPKSRSADEDALLLYGGYEPLTVTVTHILNRKAGIGWTTYAHTGVPVPTYAIGAGQELFNGFYDNTDLYYKMFALMKLK
jgi:alkaline phosphatase